MSVDIQRKNNSCIAESLLKASCVRIYFLIEALEAMDTSSSGADTMPLEKKVLTVLLMISIFEL